MKGLSIKKLAAVAVGGALIGSALAPVVSAAVTSNVGDLQKSDIVNTATGAPAVNVVVGSGAAPSDFIWAGNVAAKVAQLATVDKTVTVTGGGGEVTANPTDLSVDLTVGGDIEYSTETSKTYEGTQYPLNSSVGETTADNDPLVKQLTNAQLPFLTNETRTYRYNGSSYSIVVKENIGLEVDPRMDLVDKDVEDLVAYLTNEGDFNYILDLGDGIPADVSTTSAVKFTDGDNDNIVIPFLGEEYTVQEVDRTAGVMKLIKESNKATFYEADELTGLTGRGNYAGEEMSVRIDAVTQSGEAANYNVRYLLLDTEGNEIDRQTLGTGVYLNDQFLDSTGEYALKTVVYISDAGKETTTGKGFATITQGTSVIELKSGKAYPYDSTDTDTTDDYWKATFAFNTDASPDVNVLKTVTIYNAVKKWNSVNPLYPTTGSLTSVDASGEAIFLDGNDEDDVGYNFVRFRFDGFVQDQDTTTFTLGVGNCETSEGAESGCLIYTDSAGVEREVPLYYELLLTTGPTEEGTFMLDDQTFYYRCDTTDANIAISNGSLLNGISVIMPPTIGTDANIATDYGYLDINGTPVDTFDINGVSYTNEGMGGTATTVYLGADGNCQFSNQSFSNYTEGSSAILSINSAAPIYDTVFYDDDNQSLDKAWGYPNLAVTNDALQDTYNYKMYVTDEAAYKKVYLLLDNSTDFTNEFASIDAFFTGTDAECDGYGMATYYSHSACTVEDGTIDQRFYVPDLTSLGFDPADFDYFVANFGFDTNKSGADVNAYLDTSSGELIIFPNAQREEVYGYQVDINYIASWGLRTDSEETQSTATWLDYGSKVELVSTDAEGDYVKITVPENQLYLRHVVLGAETAVTAAGGTSFAGLGEGQSGEEGSTKITIDAISYTAGVCGAGDAVASPATYADVIPVGQLVYLDTPKPAGANIIIGGWMVNALVSESTSIGEGTLGEALTTSGDRVVQLLDNGDIVVAGYGVNDTKQAAMDLIAALDALV